MIDENYSRILFRSPDPVMSSAIPFVYLYADTSDSYTILSSAGSLSALTPASGSILNIDPELARWTPITATMNCGPGRVPYVFVVVGSLRWTVYDGTQNLVMPFFGDHTTVTSLGGNAFAISVLPNGGWWRSSIDIRFVSGTELT